MPLILRLLALLIVLYRRCLSGRGPLRTVRCSFAPEESCSAYGLRMAHEASSARVAIARIARRLRRCRDAWLVTDGTALSWTPLHDRPAAEISALMHADGERAASIARLLHTRQVVARWRGEPVATALHATPFVASHPGVVRRARRRIAILVGVAVVAAVTMLALPWIGSVALGIAALGVITSTRTTLAHARRFAQHARIRRTRLGHVVR